MSLAYQLLISLFICGMLAVGIVLVLNPQMFPAFVTKRWDRHLHRLKH